MTKGRKSLPTVIKKTKSTLRPCRVNSDEPNYPQVNGLPDPPHFLDRVGKDIYYEVGNILISTGVLKSVNVPLLIAYCQEMSTYIDVNTDLRSQDKVLTLYDKEGKVIKSQVNPYFKISNDSLMNALRLACEFGLTPASSSKIISTKLKEKDSIFD